MQMQGAKKLIFSGANALISGLATTPTAQRLAFNLIRLNRPEFQQMWAQDEIRFLSYAFALRERSKSQIMQDLWVCFELGEKRDGFFVEFGATNGLTNSNTWLLENAFGWRGLLAEPNPFWHAKLTANRRAVIDHRCVSSTSGDLIPFLLTDESDPELSGIAHFADGDHFAATRSRGKQIDVTSVTLSDFLRDHDAPREIDYISIDTEGNELDILSAFDFNRHRFQALSVEQNAKTEPGIEALLKSQGYVRVFPQFSQWDGWYVAEELRPRPKPEIYAPAA